MEYKILIKYTSTLSTIYYRFYTVEDNGNKVEYATSDIEDLKKIIFKLVKEFGADNIKIVTDVTYSITIGINSDSEVTPNPESVVQDIYNNIYNETFGGN